MGSTFKNLVVISPTVKTNSKSDKQFDLQNILNFRIFHLTRDDIINCSFFTVCMRRTVPARAPKWGSVIKN